MRSGLGVLRALSETANRRTDGNRQLISLLALPLLFLAACKGSTPSSDGSNAAPAPGKTISLNAAGSTFIYPLMSRWSSDYQKVDPNVQVNYQSIGSGGGIRQLIAKTVQFGATDGPDYR